MADKLQTTLPPSKPFPGSLTPGWNDPPPINDVSRPPGRLRLNLNKRVAFPMQSETGISLQSSTNLIDYVLPNQLPVESGQPSPTLLSYPNQELHTAITNLSTDVSSYAIEEHQT